MAIPGIRSLLQPTMLPSTCCMTLASSRTMQFDGMASGSTLPEPIRARRFREGMSLQLKSSGDNSTVSTIQSCIPRKIANTSRETRLCLQTQFQLAERSGMRRSDGSVVRRTLPPQMYFFGPIDGVGKSVGSRYMRSYVVAHPATTKFLANSFVFKKQIEREGLPRDSPSGLGAGLLSIGQDLARSQTGVARSCHST